MNTDPLARYLQRLPSLITFFFSIVLVTVFRELATTFHWTTAPSFDIRNPGHDLIVISFATTLFFMVSVWLSYSLLIERFPYTLNYTLFFFDVLRFSILYIIFNYSFLAGYPPHYQNYLGVLVVWHLMMAGWHANRLRHLEGTERLERSADIRGHSLRAATYLLLALIYYVAVTRQWQAAQPWALHGALVVITSALVVYWSARRLQEVREKALAASKANAEKTSEASKVSATA